LVNRTDMGYEKTEIAKELSESFDEIMVDECQDINEVQNLIFKVLSKNEQNIFMVGDVKQSVYRFRKAMPKLFIDKKNRFPKYNPETHQRNSNALITLENNFRSRSEVCDTVNYIFSQIMSEHMGEIDYNEEESLVPAAKYEPYEEACSEVHILNYNKEDEREKAVVEIHYIGNLIKRMIAEGYLVQDKNGMRKCTYRDFAILLRAKKEKGRIFANELNAMDIPCFSDSTEGYFNEYEIMVTLNLLRVIDNPLLDVCLLSVLMSPMFHFSADAITKIRLAARNVPLYIAVNQCAQNGDAQCKEFIDILNSLRQKAATVKTDEIIQEIYDKTDFLSLCYAMGNGEQKDANLRLLLTYAKQYESIGNSGLSGFLRYIERVIENKQDFSCANTISQNANTVKIMSIHSSKGLEFPICILADCGKKFNKTDLNRSYQFNSELGFGMKITDQQALKSYINLPYEAIRLQTEKETISEEMRVLYVALTRAKEKLIMVMTMEKAYEKVARLASSLPSKKKLSPYDVYSASSYADWILSATLRHESFLNIRNEINVTNVPLIPGNFKMKGYIVNTTEQDAMSAVAVKEKTAAPDETILEELQRAFSFQYPNQELTQIPAKLTVTKLAKEQRDAEIVLKAEPSFLQKQGITPAMRGTILHSFMQFADYKYAKENLDGEIARLVEQEFLTKEQAEALNIPKIQAFLQSPLFARMEQAQKVLREYKFLHFINASEVDETLSQPYQEEKILMQGIADCLLFENDGIVLVDYKTDYVEDEQVLIDRYYDQLRIYKQAVESAFHQTVKQCLLYSLHLEREIEVFC
jgi:ATP-dependent helicase/nuclease subunit A